MKHKRTKDFTNKIYGTLKATSPTTSIKYRMVIWEFNCLKCNDILYKIPSHLGPNSYCGKAECGIGITHKNLTGEKFGKLTVLSFFGQNKTKQLVWDCLCECGNNSKVITARLTSGITQSCGCNRSTTHTKMPGEVSWNSRWSKHLDSSCKDRNIENELSQEEFMSICSENCFYCNIEPRPYNNYLNNDGQMRSHVKKHGLLQETADRAWIKINGIDRVDNDRGYSLDNCVPCCWGCNEMKSSLNFYKWCAFIERFESGFTQKMLTKLEKLGIKLSSK